MLRVLALIFCATVFAARAEDPFKFESTPGRLPKDVIPEHYAIRIDPDVEAARFTGTVRIDVNAKQATREIVLNSTGLKIRKAAIDGAAVTVRADDHAQLLHLTGAEFAPGKHRIELEFEGQLSEKPQGLYLTRYQLPGGETRKALVTQMEATDARRMFPCWDEPVFRATFQLTAVVPGGHTAISNMPEASVQALPGGRREIAFTNSPNMPSYLLAFASAELETLEGEIAGTKLRILATPGKREQMRFAMDATKKILPYFNDYFGVPYPLPKLDQVSFPSVAASGMENWGCIIYSDTALLFDEANSAHRTRERVFDVVAHELAHQWFGNLVTMAWWDNLWLNEGFASWMAAKTTDKFNPSWKKWLRAASSKERAMQLDARATTHPIQQPVESESDAMQAFDEITYQKGQAFLRMLESWLGEDAFRDGLRAYFKEHAYGNTTTADLWSALEASSGKEVRAMAAGWTEQPGFPVVRADGNQFTQRRFTIHQKAPAPLTWDIPLVWKSFPDGVEKPLLLRGEPQPQPSPAGEPAIHIPSGYYRVAYEGAAWEAIAPHFKKLPEASRLAIAQDTWALVQSADYPLARWLTLVEPLRNDESPTVSGHLVDVLNTIHHLSRGSNERPAIRAWIREVLAPQFQAVGWEPRPGEEPAAASHRAALISILGRCGDPAVLAEAKMRAAKFLETPGSLPADLREPVLHLAGRAAAPSDWDRLHRLAKAEPSAEQKYWLYGALVATENADLSRRALALSLTGELPAKLATRLVSRVAAEGENPEEAWTFAKAKLPDLLVLMSANAADEFVSWIFRSFSDSVRASELESFTKANLPPSAARPTAIAADEIRFKAALKERLLPELSEWLKARRTSPQP